MQRRGTAWLCLWFLLSAGAASARDTPLENPFPGVAQAYWVQINGVAVWQQNSHQRLPSASLTKLMTALLVSEQLPPGTPVTVDQAAARETGSRLGLRLGETLTADDLLGATLVASANDACRALANHIGGNEARFVETMNRRAGQLGLTNTRFTNACGHDAPGHFASVHDIARLTQAAMQVAQIARWVAQAQTRITTMNRQRSYTLKTTNALIGRYDGVLGVKTGTTPKAGNCLVALVGRGRHEVMLVMLKGRDRWWDAVDVLDIAFARANANANAEP